MQIFSENSTCLRNVAFYKRVRYLLVAFFCISNFQAKPQLSETHVVFRFGQCGINDYLDYSSIEEDKGFILGLGVNQNFSINKYLGLTGDLEWVWCSPVQKYGVFDSYYNFDVLTLEPNLIGINTEAKLRLRLDNIFSKAELNLLKELKGLNNFLEVGVFYSHFFVKSINARFEGKRIPESAYANAAYGICIETCFEFNRDDDYLKNKMKQKGKKKKGRGSKQKSKIQWNTFAKGNIGTNLFFNDLYATGNSGYFYTISMGIRFKLGKKG